MRIGIATGALLAGMTGVGATAAAAHQTPTPSPSPYPSGTQTCPGMGQMHRITSEYDYLSQMIPHHQDAVTAAQQLQRSKRPEMRQLGQSIVTTQTAEINEMKGWLARWYPRSPTPAATPTQTTMPDLSGLSGDQLDRTFLQHMIPHHMMAIMMSQQLLMHGLAQHPEVTAFARKVRDDQWAEVQKMRQWLVQWFGQQSMPCMPNLPGMPGTPGMGPGEHGEMSPGHEMPGTPGRPTPTEPSPTGS